MKKYLLIIFIVIIGVISLAIWNSERKSSIKEELAKLDIYSEEELSFLEKEGFFYDIDSENLPDNKEQIAYLFKSPSLVEQNLNSPDESFEVLATKLNKSNKSYQLAFKLENKSNESKEFYLIPVSEKDQLQFKEIKGLVNNTNLLSLNKDDARKEPLNELYDVEQHKQELRPELSQAYRDIETNNYKAEPIRIVLASKSTVIANSQWDIINELDDLKPVYFLVYGSAAGAKEDLTILDVHSHPAQGENWEVEFTTRGMADLKIIPADQATIDDDEFTGLFCDNEERFPQILEGDVIYYANWQCNGIGKVIHYTLIAGNHKLRFEFADQISYAYNAVALTFHDGFETGGADAWASAIGTVSFTPDSVNTGNYKLSCSVNAAAGYVSNAVTRMRATAYLYIIATPEEDLCILGRDNAAEGAIYLTTAKKLDLRINGVSQDLGATVLDSSKWYRMSIGVDGDNGKIYLDGVEECSAASANFDNIYENLGIITVVSGTEDIKFDDYASDNTVSTDDIDDIRTLAARPVGEGTDQDTAIDDADGWVDSTQAAAGVYTELDNDPPNITAYNRFDGAGTCRYSVIMDECGSGNLADIGGSDTIEAVNFMFYYETEAGGATDYGSKIIVSDGTLTDDDIDDPRDPTWLKLYHADTPSGANAWTQAYVNSIEMGMAGITPASKGIWFHEAYAMVAYIPDLGTPPTISSVKDGPDPIEVGQAITFYVYWTDVDEEGVKLYVCKGDDGTSSGCGGNGTWCEDSDTYDTTTPLTCDHTIVSGDIGAGVAYYAFVCDIANNCSTTDASSQGTFTASAVTSTSLKFDGGIKFEGGIIIK